MINNTAMDDLTRLVDVLRSCSPAAVAVSGGVDSMTLAFVAHRVLGDHVQMFHAVSPAVPPSATARVSLYAEREHWLLNVLDAGEFADARYLANPANRCFFCKSNLYGTISAHTDHQLLSGTNLDDLGDWRPGLKAAADHSARHPYVEATIDKNSVRAISRYYELDDIAELPASPCLSSRVETGISIAPRDLQFIDAAEQLVGSLISLQTVRCRIRKRGVVIELDGEAHATINPQQQLAVTAKLDQLSRRCGVSGPIEFATYERGSAFLRDEI